MSPKRIAYRAHLVAYHLGWSLFWTALVIAAVQALPSACELVSYPC